VELKTKEEIDLMEAKENPVVVFYGEDGSKEWEEFSILARAIDDATFRHVFDEELRKEVQAVQQAKLVLKRDFEPTQVTFEGEFTLD
jgi:hypothetical protein